MYESYTRQALPSKKYRELIGTAICVFNCKRPLNPIPILIRFRFPAVWQQFFNLGHFMCRQPFQHIT